MPLSDSMSQTSPHLTPHFCFSTTALRDFLRISRSSVDDPINQQLNALVTPARAGFDPSSTSHRASRPLARQVDAQSCKGFKDKVLFPSWQSRSDVLNYCALVATSPDPDDPIRIEAKNEKNQERVVDERLDPYSARSLPNEPRTEKLASVVRQERGIENIIRSRTWGIVKERCGETVEIWEEALAGWQRATAQL
ncbi:caffeine-induced death protein 2 [Lasiosphaeria ovina]|uniref:Caffeine-induced death protein 2 n=1 Tax=Lasiosphaeria ovina TaxID=92902 RepID=A0AAE0JSS2_9PEZI|nr:caffeine-induced death protein 2 [Lasiosphaeria ovina]